MKHKIRSCFALLLAVSTLITSVPAGVFASEPAVTMEEESSTSGAEEETYDFSETKAKETESDEEALSEETETESETAESMVEQTEEWDSAEMTVQETEDKISEEEILKEETEIQEAETTIAETETVATDLADEEEKAEITEFSVQGNGSVFVYADGKKVAELSGNASFQKVESLDGKDLTYTMLPFQGNFAYSVKRNEEIVAEDCWENCGADAAYSGCLFRSGGTYVFCFMTEEELAAIPLPLGDGSLFQGGRNDHLLGFGSMPGQNMDDPKAGEYYTARAVFYPAVGGYNVHNYFNLQQGYVYPSEDSDIYQKFGSAFRMTTCGSSAAQICPRPGATGTLYIYIDQVTENTVVYQAAWRNDNGTQQNVYGNFKTNIPKPHGGIVIHKRLVYADRAATAVYQLDAVFDVLDASGKKAGSITTDPATGEGYLSDLDPGTYTIKEVKAPKYATLSTASWNCTVSTGKQASVTVKNYPYMGIVFLNKKSSAGQWDDSMKGAVYGIWDSKDCSGEPLVRTTITSERTKINRFLAFDQTYYVKEISAPPSGKWGLSGKIYSVKFSEKDLPATIQKDADQFVGKDLTVTEDEPSNVKVRVNKTSSLSRADFDWLTRFPNYSLAGAAYTFYWDEACQDAIGTVYTHTLESGFYTRYLEIPGLKPEESRVIYYQEAWASSGHARNLSVKSLQVTAPKADSKKDALYTVKDEDLYVFGSLNNLLKKVGSDGEEYRPLAGAQFELKLYDSPQGGEELMAWLFETNAEGNLKLRTPLQGKVYISKISNLTWFPMGYYTIRETKAPAGYICDPTVRSFSLLPENDSVSADGKTTNPICRMSETWPELVNQQETGELSLKKTSAKPELTAQNGLYSFEGAEFGIYETEDFSGEPKVLVRTKETGETDTVTLPVGTYYVKERKAPAGYRLSQEVKKVVLALGDHQEVIFEDEPFYQQVETAVQKEVKGGTNVSKEGAEFTLRYYSGESLLRTWVLKTDAEGLAKFEDSYKISGDSFCQADGKAVLPLGRLTIEETKAPAGLLVDPAVRTFVSDESGIYTDANGVLFTNRGIRITDEPVYGGMKISKRSLDQGEEPDGDARFEGAVFVIYNKNSYSVTRKDQEDDSYPTDAEVMRITADAAGLAETAAVLQAGTYLVKELTAPEGYLLSEEELLFTIPEDKPGEIVDLTETPVRDQVIRGGFALSKWDLELNEPGKFQGDATLEGAEFTLTNESEHSVLVNGRKIAPGEVIDTFRTDAEGKIETAKDLLPYGSYKLEETCPPTGYTRDGENLSRIFKVRKNGKVYRFDEENSAAKNRVSRFDITLVKFKDTLSSEEPGDHVLPLEGCRFEIRLKSTGELYAELVTDKDGVATTKDPEHFPNGRLPYGTYVVTETEHPASVMPITPFEIKGEVDRKEYTGIYLNDRPIEMPVTLVKKSGDQDLIIPAAGTEFQVLDEKKKPLIFHVYYPHAEEITTLKTDESGTITIPEKLPYGTYYLRELQAPEGYLKGEDLCFTVDKWGSWTKPMEVSFHDEPVKGRIKLFKMDAETKELLAGAVFSVFAAEDIVTPDGFCHYAKDEFIESVTIGADGTGSTGNLPLGKYIVRETKAPEGYCLDTASYPAELVYENQETALVTAELTLENHPTTWKLFKTDTAGNTLDGVTFSVQKVVAADETENLPEAVLVTTADGGKIEMKYVTAGTYVIREISTLPGYLLDTKERYFTVDEEGFIFESDSEGRPLDEDCAKSDTETLRWINDYTKWDISKTDITGDQELEGAELELHNDQNELIETWISGKMPHRIERLTPGKYLLTEKIAPAGYVTANTITFEVTEDGEVHRITMIDQCTRVKISKRDITNQTELPGAHLEILNEKGEVLESWISREEPHYVEKLPAGSYHLRETIAPDGYEKTEDVIFEVKDTMEIQTVFMYDSPVKETEPVPVETEVPDTEPAETEPVETEKPETEPAEETETETPETKVPETEETETETETKMTETATSETSISETPSSENSKKSNAPKTGDTTDRTVEVSVLLLSGTVLLAFWKKNRKSKKSNE